MIDERLQLEEWVVFVDESSPSDAIGQDGRDAEVRQAMVGMLILNFANAHNKRSAELLMDLEEVNKETEWRQQLSQVVSLPNHTAMDTHGLLNLDAQVPIHHQKLAGYLCDAVELYARALHRVLDAGGRPQDAHDIVNTMRSTSFAGVSGWVEFGVANTEAGIAPIREF